MYEDLKSRLIDSRLGIFLHLGVQAMQAIQHLEQEIAYKQSKIDSLMLEYCPEEMTEEQLRVWGENQVPFKEIEK